MKHLIKILVLGAFSSLLLTACGDSSSSGRKTTTRSNKADCYDQDYDTGIIGNEYCPYRGNYDPNYGYQAYAVGYSAHFGVYVDFGWNYNDMCPAGEVPVLNNGDFSYCMAVNPNYAQTDLTYYSAPNAGECAGKQWNTHVTGCLIDFDL